MSRISNRLYSAEQTRQLDHRAIAGGIPGYALMQRAAAACWQALRDCAGAPARLVVICGAGNNGGDGYEIARLARADGVEVVLLSVGGEPAKGDGATACAAWRADGGTIREFDGRLPASEWVIDALFGTGLSRAPTGVAADAIGAITAARQAGARVLAVDVPSGLDASTGHCPGACVSADLTVSFIGNKLGLWTGQGPAVAGLRRFDTLEVPDDCHEDLAPQAVLQSEADLACLKPRARDGHKGAYGHVLVVGGNSGMAGAALLAGRAALRAGAGLVSLATRKAHTAALTAAQPELMVHGIDTPEALDPLLARASMVAIGPGLGQDEWARALFARVLAGNTPLLLDADALNLLARLPRRRDDWVLTPHPGEAARLLQRPVTDIQADRLQALQDLQARYGGAVVLKGAGSLVSGSPPRVCAFGNPGMATGGSGDTLTGIVAALHGQGLSADDAAGLGVLVHALAGDRAAKAGERGLLPSDLIDQLRTVVNP